MSAFGLQKAVYTALSNDPELLTLLGGVSIFDAVPASRQLPMVVLGEVTGDDWSTSENIGQALIMTIRCWSSAQGRNEVYQIADRVRAIMASPLQMAPEIGSRIALLQPVSSRYERDVAQDAMRATLRFRILIEPAD